MTLCGLVVLWVCSLCKADFIFEFRKSITQKIDFSFIGFPCVLPRENESVLVGSAILGACASGDFTSIQVGT